MFLSDGKKENVVATSSMPMNCPFGYLKISKKKMHLEKKGRNKGK
jgi:hypothetical protein